MNLKNSIVAALMLLIVGTAGWVASKGGPFNGGEHGKVIADMGDRTAAMSIQTDEKDDRQKEE